MKKRRAILIFGDPDAGKSWLASQLSGKYITRHIISLDEVYVEFVKEKLPNLYLPDLMVVIAQHHRTILGNKERKAWEKYVVTYVAESLEHEESIIVEGYLLLPVLDKLQKRLSRMAEVKVIEVRNRQYFVLKGLEEL